MIRRFFFQPVLFVVSFLLCSVHAYAQSADWEKELGKISGKVQQVEYLVKLTEDYDHSKEMIAPMQKAVQLAKETGIDSLIGKTIFNLGACYFTAEDISSASPLFQKARFFALKAHAYKLLGSIIYWQSKILVHTIKPDSLIRFLDKNQPLINLSSSAKQRNGIELMYGIAYMMQNKNQEALEVYTRLLPKAEMAQDTDFVVALCINIGQLQHSFDSSMFWYNKVLDITRTSDLSKYADLLADIAWTYSQQDDARKDSALYYYKEAEKYVQYMDRPLSRLILYNNTGEFFYQKGEFNLALPYFRKALALIKQNQLEAIIPYNNLALVFIATKQLDSAGYYHALFEKGVQESGGDYEKMLYHQLNALYARAKGDSCSEYILDNFEKTIAYAVKFGDTRHATHTIRTEVLSCIVSPELKQTEAVKAIGRKIIQHCAAIYGMVKAENKLVNFSAFLESYASLEELYGDRQKAMELYKEIVKVQNEISETKYREGINEILVKHKTELKDSEILLLKTESRFILAGMGALFLILLLIVILYRRENKNKRELDIRNKKVEELLREIHHRVKNNLQIVSSFINIQLDKVKDQESVQSLMDTSRRIMALAGLHHSLYRQDDFSTIQLEEYITELSNNIKNTMQLKTDVSIRYDLEKLQLDMDKAIPLGLSLNELVTNALKYAFTDAHSNPLLTISLHRQNNNQWELVVRDNGKGIPEQTDPAQKKSIGLRLVQNLVQRQVKGTFDYYNEEGAVFKITFSPPSV